MIEHCPDCRHPHLEHINPEAESPKVLEKEFIKAVERTDYWIDKYDRLYTVVMRHARWCADGPRLEKDVRAVLGEGK